MEVWGAGCDVKVGLVASGAGWEAAWAGSGLAWPKEPVGHPGNCFKDLPAAHKAGEVQCQTSAGLAGLTKGEASMKLDRDLNAAAARGIVIVSWACSR
jgi:hypothetical protein